MVMIPNGPGQANNYVEFINDLKELVASGRVPESRIDDAATRIIRAKMELGLFEHPDADPALLASIGSAKHREVARECVRESLVLLKNNHQTLPLSKKVKHLAVVGKAADDLGIQCGGWTISWQGSPGPVTHGGTTLLAAIKQTVSSDTQVTYSPDGNELAGADAVIVAIVEMPYAEMKGDRSDLSLSAEDAALVEKAKALNVPVVTVLYSGRPLVLGKTLDQTDAFVAAWLPGTEGLGMTDVLFGDFKPTGHLPRQWPQDNSGLSSMESTAAHIQPQFASGYGLTFKAGPREVANAVTHE
jgi:beta-glucosidase